MSIKFGMVGTGAMAALMAPAFRLAGGVDLTAISSASLDRARLFASLHGIDASYEGVAQLLRDETIDAIYVANGTADHAKTAIAALNAGKHVLCEKPFALTAAEGERVIEAARASGKLFMEGLWTHFLPAYARVQQLCQEQAVGAVRQLTAAYGYPTNLQRSPRLFQKPDGGVLLDIGVYPVSLALRVMGPVSTIQSSIVRDTNGVDTHVSMLVCHERGLSQLTASFSAMTANSASVSCEHGLISIPAPLFGAETVIVERHTPNIGAIGDGAIEKLKSALKQNPLARRIKNAFIGGEHHPFGADRYLPQMMHFAALIENEKLESDIVSHEFSLDVLRVLDQVRVAAEPGGAVE